MCHCSEAFPFKACDIGHVAFAKVLSGPSRGPSLDGESCRRA